MTYEDILKDLMTLKGDEMEYRAAEKLGLLIEKLQKLEEPTKEIK